MLRFAFLRRRFFWVALLSLTPLCGGLFVILPNWWVLHRARPFIFTRLDRLPENQVGLVLGTSRYDRNGEQTNPFFIGRMNTAARLYKAGKVKHLLLSGDNSHDGYDEPTWMQEALVERGIPASAITLDYAGFRTYDSIVRAHAVFGLDRFTVITDDFHESRSVFLARSLGLEAVGFPSEHVPFPRSRKTRARELASRTVACLDVYVLHTHPRFYGPPVKIAVQDR